MKRLLLILIIFLSYQGIAQQFTYRPLNPAFGGDGFNYSWLLNSANVQNKLTAPANQREQLSELDQFGQTLNRQILSQISRALLQQQIQGIGNFDTPGTFTFGSLAVEVFESAEGLVINILDTATGEETQVVVPNGN